jgi:hypothetical protein
MSYDDAKSAFVKEKIWIIELDLDYCNLTYGTLPCTAEVGVTGEQKCFNTAKTCQDRANYDAGVKTYRYCTKLSPLPAGLDANPSLKAAPSIDGAKINPSGGLGVRGGISMSFIDAPHSDIGIDKYVDERSYIPYETGTEWGKLRARNPFYNNRPLRAFSGYLVDGIYDPLNFQQRSYIIENISANRGTGSVSGKDVLKLADDDRAQYPLKTNGELTIDIDSVVTSFTMTPAGVGNLEYDASGWVRIADEVMSFTRVADVMTIVRGQYTTLANTHDSGDTVQQCKYLNDTTANLVNELLTVGANVDPVFIPLVDWQIESDDNYPYLLETLLTEPIGVQKLLKELGDNAPHFLYFDERTQLINFTAVQEPPINVNTVNNQDHIMKDSLKVQDMPKARLSDILVYFGQRDPTKKMDEINNYAQTYIRSDLLSSSADEYGSEKIQTIFSRWINNFNKAAALELAARKGRRLGITPRQVNFKMTSKDSDYWLGDNLGIDHPVLQTFTGETGNNIFQITSVKEAGDFNYTALEYLYAEALPDDPELGIDLVIIGGNENDLNLRTIYESIFGTPDIDSEVKFIIDNGVEVGSTSTGTYAIETGAWPVGMDPIKLFIKGYGQGRGGNGVVGANGTDGGPCLNMSFDVTIEDVTGLLAGGGGGGGSVAAGGFNARGGGGAGIIAGSPFATRTDGYPGEDIEFFDMEPQFLNAGNGGNPGVDGQDGTSITTVPTTEYTGGSAGVAINKNGNTLIIENGAGNIKGAII